MSDFTLIFGPPSNEGCYPLHYRLYLAGERVGHFCSPFDQPSLEAFLTLVRNPPRPGEETEALGRNLMAFGQALYQALWGENPTLAGIYESLPANARLILAFEPEATALLRLPWEYITGPDGHPLAAQRPLARRILGLELPPRPSRPGAPPRLLTVIAEPADQVRFRARRVHDFLLDQLRPLAEKGLLAVDFLPPVASPTTLKQALMSKRYDILHFVGHGRLGGLVLEGEAGGSVPIEAGRLRSLIRGRGTRLILLTSCLTGAMEDDLASGVATTLVKAGVSGVVALQFPALVKEALEFVGDIYRAMTGEWRRPLAEAVWEARRGGYFEQEHYRWGVPVIYLQDESLGLFAQTGEGQSKPLPVNAWSPPSPHNLPHQENFVGRGRQIVEVGAALSSRRLVVITGAGGIGKTELAKAAGHRWAERSCYPDGIRWIDVENVSTLDAWLTILAAALNLTPQPDPLTQLVTHLDGRRALLVLNNMEAALESADGDAVREALTRLRDATTSPRFLITSRSVPNVGEKRVHLGTMSVEESVSLFLMRAGLAGYRLRPEDEGAVWEIINLLDNYPLAIVLAAPQLADMSPAALLEALHRNKISALRDPTRRVGTRLTSLEVSLSLSYGRLSPQARHLFAVLSIFVGGAGASGLDTVYGEGWRTPMSELLRRSLAERVRGADRYFQLIPVREYAAARLRADQMETYRREAARHYLDIARAANEVLKGQDAVQAASLMRLELANMQAGMDWAAAADNAGQQVSVDRERLELVRDYAFALDDFLDWRGYWGERVARIRQGMRACEELGDEGHLSRLKHNLALALQDQGKTDEAKRLYEENLESERKLGNRRGMARSLHQLGMTAQAEGNYRRARRLYEESLEIFRELGDRRGIASSLHQLGMMAQAMGEYGQAQQLYEESLEISKKLDDKHRIASSLHRLGNMAYARRKYSQARQLYEESLEILRELGDQGGVASSLHNLGAIAQALGEYNRARQWYEESLEIERKLGDGRGAAISLHQLGMIAQAVGENNRARQFYEEAGATFQKLGARSEQASVLGQLGRLAEEEGRPEEAVLFWLQAAAIFQQLGSPNLQPISDWIARLRGRVGEERFQEIIRQTGEEMGDG
jgi:tetratricopeptide (TPR) repeat protein